MANEQNLIPIKTLTSEEAKKRGSNGGKASAKARRERKLLSEMYADLLSEEFEVKIGDRKEKITGQKYFKTVAREIVNRRDSASVSMLKEIREATEGSKVAVDSEVSVVDITATLSHEDKVKLAKAWAEKNLANGV